jgi:transmembrane sensor
MNDAPADSPPLPEGDPAAAATAWLARRDRGFSAAEQDAFADWLAADPLHRAAFARLDRTWAALDSLAAWQPSDGAAPNPDLLAPARPAPVLRRARFLAFAGLGLAAALAAIVWRPFSAPPDSTSAPGVRVIPKPEARALADGSVAELNHGSRVALDFKPNERRVRLDEGELFLTVAKDPERPFVVDAGQVLVRAVGTAFSVRREADGIDVLVTEGSVRVEPAGGAPVTVAQGERSRVEGSRRPLVAPVTPEIIARDHAWREVRLEFADLPLRSVVSEFNLRNTRQLAVGDPAAGNVKVAGTFRADQPEAFVRLLEAGFGIAVERHPDAPWVLRLAEGAKKK